MSNNISNNVIICIDIRREEAESVDNIVYMLDRFFETDYNTNNLDFFSISIDSDTDEKIAISCMKHVCTYLNAKKIKYNLIMQQSWCDITIQEGNRILDKDTITTSNYYIYYPAMESYRQYTIVQDKISYTEHFTHTGNLLIEDVKLHSEKLQLFSHIKEVNPCIKEVNSYIKGVWKSVTVPCEKFEWIGGCMCSQRHMLHCGYGYHSSFYNKLSGSFSVLEDKE